MAEDMVDMVKPEGEGQEGEKWHPDEASLNRFARLLLLRGRDWRAEDESFGATDRHVRNCLNCTEAASKIQLQLWDLYEYNARINRAVIDNEELPQSDTAADEVEAGILSPLGEFVKTLDLTPQEIQTIEKYARLASEEARKKKEQELLQNPLLGLDDRFAKEIVAIEKDDKMHQQVKEDQIFYLTIARERLRETNHNIKAPVDLAVQAAQKTGEQVNLSEIVQDLCEQQKRPEGISGYFYTELVTGEPNKYERVMKVLGLEETIKFVADEVSEFKYIESRSRYESGLIHDISIGVAGVYGEIPQFTKSGGNKPYVYFGVSFDQDAVLRIAQSPELTPLN